MANLNKPFGLRPVGSLNSGPWNQATRKYAVLAADTDPIYIGDMVKIAATNTLTATRSGTHPVAIATKVTDYTTDVILGVVTGIEPLFTDLSVTYRKASTLMGVFVCTDPQALYAVQGDADTFDPADVGLNSNLTTSTASTTTGISNLVLDQNTVETTTTLPVQIIGMQASPDNDVSSTAVYPVFLVKINRARFSQYGATGIS
jgi:hypothetical protein